MTELLTAAQMKAIEQAAIDSGAVTGLELMERAGRGVVDAIFAEWPDLQAAPHKAVVLCGPGNNGGDGFVVARLLKQWGWEVAVFLYGDPDKLPPDAKTNYARWTEMGEVAPFGRGPVIQNDTVVIDALFGIGQNRPLPEAIAATAAHAAIMTGIGQARLVAVDVPSGLDSDSGRAIGESRFFADLTVTFHTMKPGHVLADGPAACGSVATVDIGLRPEPDGDAARLVTAAGPVGKGGTAHKYDHGHALILSGGMGRSGAARLSARAALRIGAGLVTVAAPGSAMMECACQLTAIMLRPCDDAADLTTLLEDTRLNALCLGPGLGAERARDLVPAALGAGRAVVLDADALTAYADAPDALFDLLHDKCVLTPHMGEFARLFPDIADKLSGPAETGPAFSKVDAAREAAARAGCTVLLKGADTVIAEPGGRAAISAALYDRAAPWLATAGAGDVLAGMIAGLLARGFDPMSAAESAAWLHVEAALRFGPGLIAEDLPEMLPAVLSALAQD
ncbi:NAD(P)H-hydrate dehydratase [Rhodobacterales bacterium HKCCE3408]|nr:NAD(P)H-hydrate dehydratase [Rhodobacterales bacterium HKCCE3408]